METFSLKDPFAWGFLSYFFCMPVCILSLISVKKTEGHMWNCIIFYFSKKKKWNEMRWERNLVLNNEMRMNDMKMKPCTLIIMMVKHCTKKTKESIYKKNFKKKLVFFPACHHSSSSVHVPFPEIEIKRQLMEIFQLLTRTALWDSALQTIIYTDLSLSALINHLTCLSLSLHALCSSSSFSLASSSSFSTLLYSTLLKI